MMFKDGFAGLERFSLVLQHRALTDRLDAIESAISACQCADLGKHETAARILPLLRGLTHSLPSHFATEARSKAVLVGQRSDAEIARELSKLDREHPRLLALFETSVEELGRCATPADRTSFERAMADLLTAVGELRSHEAREDALLAE